MNIPKIFELIEDPALFESFVYDLVADCVHGIKLPYIKKYPQINHYGLLVEAQNFMQQFSEILLELNNQNAEEVQKLLDKLKQQMKEDQHQIFTHAIKQNFRAMTKNALIHQISLSKYVLIDYNWNLNLTISSDKIARSQQPTILLELLLEALDNSKEPKKIVFEMNKEELEVFINQLVKINQQVGYL